jgi:hypothetical protein
VIKSAVKELKPTDQCKEGFVLVRLLLHCNQIPKKSNLKEQTFLVQFQRVQSTMAGRAWLRCSLHHGSRKQINKETGRN